MVCRVGALLSNSLKKYKSFCIEMYYIGLNHTPGPILLVLVEIIAVTFLINSKIKCLVALGL